MIENPSYYSIIPADVRYDKRLMANAKLLYSEITALCNMYGFCFAKNQYFQDLYGVTQQAITGWIKQLADCGYIKVDFDENGKRCIKIVEGVKENLYPPLKENLYPNNINNNIIKENPLKESFEMFWKEYPKQRAGSKDKAFKSYCRAIKEKRATEEKILDVCKKYAVSDEVKRGFAKGCAAWLNDDRFNVEYENKESMVAFW